MIDLEKWIYSKDIAAWIEKKVPLNLEDQMNEERINYIKILAESTSTNRRSV